MRADRLIAILMLLQTRGQMTARELAREVEVSERTIYRDIEALSIAGVPVLSEAGPEGGFALLDRYRTTLTGLNEAEMRALFMLSIPEPLAELGIGRELKSALLKVTAALPMARGSGGAQMRQRFYLDSSGWEPDSSPHVQTLYHAVWQDRKLFLVYRIPSGVEAERLVEPYGLVAKAGMWYLVYGWWGRVRVQRVVELLDVRLSDEAFERPTDFDLEVFWRRWCLEQTKTRSLYPVTVRAAPQLLPVLARLFGAGIQAQSSEAGPPDSEGWVTLTLGFDSLEAARDRLLGFGRAIEVLEPRSLRRSLWDFAEQIRAVYSG